MTRHDVVLSVSSLAFLFVLSAGAADVGSADVPPESLGGVRLVHPPQPHLDPQFSGLVAGLVPAAIDGEQLEPTPWVVPDEFVVRFGLDAGMLLRASPGASLGLSGFGPLDDLATAAEAVSFRPLFDGSDPVRDVLRGGIDLSGWFVVTIDAGRIDLADAMARYAASPWVLEVEEIGVHAFAAVPNDGNYASQWHLNQTNDKDIDAPEAWNVWTGSANTVVAVLDTGVRYFHKDLGGSAASSSNPGATSGNMWINLAEKNGVAGVDDDGNGFIDDWVGWDFVSSAITMCWSGEDCTGADNDPRDFNGHGTHCAGLVGAINNNGYAVASPAGGWGNGTLQPTANGVKVMALRIGHSAKVQGQQVGVVRMDFAASALYYAANNGAKIASCSWGSSNSGGLAAATTYFLNGGRLLFKAAGNSNNQTADYLCSRSDVWAVASTDQNDKKSSFSSYGTWVDISAPGTSIVSTYHVFNQPNSDYVATLSGTSMATPLVASVAASVWSKNPTWTSSQVWNKVKGTVDNIDSLNPTFVGKLGSGRVNLHKALTN